jgi:hypothetical protein
MYNRNRVESNVVSCHDMFIDDLFLFSDATVVFPANSVNRSLTIKSTRITREQLRVMFRDNGEKIVVS